MTCPCDTRRELDQERGFMAWWIATKIEFFDTADGCLWWLKGLSAGMHETRASIMSSSEPRIIDSCPALESRLGSSPMINGSHCRRGFFKLHNFAAAAAAANG